ncbi:AarF/UbiB family protein [Halobacillus salinarum]|uniref:AarF/UbiB family protein n=1 Tax=Halobacillus salinarum TaxID=2932257 RepID=A0ABY4ELE2_9BACI|nr:AarF/UbiB family protein [Halobacillus salinarum]UOQ45276.1 AarF/UbiB family protein [Halobacillus salinarum]
MGNRRMKYISIYRITVIVWMAAKFLLQIFWFQTRHRMWDQETKRAWKELLEKQAREYREKAILLGGLLIKFGQFLSSRGDLLPQSFIEELEGLVDRVEPTPFRYSRRIIEKEWKAPLDHFLSHIDEQAVASASIGEVYKAFLKDGTPVAVKVQRYRVNDIFKMDFKALRIVFWMLSRFTRYGKKADLKALYREVVLVISNELDFTMELKNGLHFKSRFQDFPSLYIPDYYEDLSTNRVLVMEWIEGTKITDLSFIHNHGINREQLAKTLFDLGIDQFLYAGMFHADPHAGNLMLKSDGTLVLIDFGMVGEVRNEDVHSLRKMIQGFILDDYDKVIEALREMEFLLEHADTEHMKKLLKQTTTMYLEGNFDKLDAHMMNDILNEMQEFVKEQPIQLPADYAFLGRATSIIIGVLTTIYPKVDLIQWGRPVMKEWMAGEDSAYALYKNIAKETARPLLSLPRALVNYLEDGDKQRKAEQVRQSHQLYHQFYLFYSLLFFVIFAAGGVLTGLSVMEVVFFPVWIGEAAAGVGAAGWLFFMISHFRLLKKYHQNRRNER